MDRAWIRGSRGRWLFVGALAAAMVLLFGHFYQRVDLVRFEQANRLASMTRFVQQVNGWFGGDEFQGRFRTAVTTYLLSEQYDCVVITREADGDRIQWPVDCQQQVRDPGDYFELTSTASGDNRLRIEVMIKRSTALSGVLFELLVVTLSILIFVLGILLTAQLRKREILDASRMASDDLASRLQAVLDNVVDGIITVDQRGIIESANPAAQRIFGYPLDEMVGRNVSMLMPAPHAAAHDGYMQRYRETGEGRIIGIGRELVGLKRGGEEFPMELALGVVRLQGKSAYTGIVRDITERKRYEAELRDAMRRAEEGVRVKDDFLAMMSHEIRTPLNGVLGMLSLLDDPSLDEARRGHVRLAMDSGRSLLRIINDILDFTKMEAGKLELETTPFPLHALVGEIEMLLAPGAQAKGLRLQSRIGDEVPEFLAGDPGRLRQILINLVGNAIKFTDFGEVDVSVAREVDERGRQQIRFEVCDSGIGVPEAMHDRLFDQFTTIDASYSRRFGGTGLGLAICRKLVELMEGGIGFESQVGRGSRFWFHVPLESSESAGSLPPLELADAANIGQPQRILVVDDTPTNRQVAKLMLERIGHHVVTAENGIEAIQAAGEQPLDLILMDINMPELDGIEAAHAIRELRGDRQIPLVAMTALAMRGDRDRLMGEGFDDYLAKPVDAAELQQMVARWTGFSAASGPTESAPADDAANAADAVVADAPKAEPPGIAAAGHAASAGEPDGGVAESPLFEPACLDRLASDLDPSMIPELVRVYLEDSRRRVGQILESAGEADFRQVNLDSHALGSASATYGLLRLHDVARAVEAACRCGDHVTALQQVDRIDEVARRSFERLEAYTPP